MVKYPNKRIFGLIGAPRSGKDTVARYLQESRDFASLAFADKIKEEFGISAEDFEAAKITGEIERLRQELWDFSAQKKKSDPSYFIRLVMEEAADAERSIVITDIRTEDEFNALFEYSPVDKVSRVYMVGESADSWESINGELAKYKIRDSKINRDFFYQQYFAGKIRKIENKVKGLHRYYRYLSNFFFKEDIMDLVGPCSDLPDPEKQYHNNEMWRNIISNYLSQFDIVEKM